MSRKKALAQVVHGMLQYHLKEYAITRIEFDALRLTLIPPRVSNEDGIYKLETVVEFNRDASILLITCKVGAGFHISDGEEPVIAAVVETRTDIHVAIEDQTWFKEKSVNLPAQLVQLLVSNSIASLRGTLRTVLGLCNVLMSPIPFVTLPEVEPTGMVEIGYTHVGH